ncbi:phage minor head protein [Fictibacillus sp. 18YEL24]|uniref:phage minor head protein n=1 Tax=Fictibacillus sp. 18YEL24 TaxID=2745875 RepID=UPI0018CD9209|nr:phage minor head protein [Fictibacillus sp. 18YEL24]MBH0171032.1 hypothetical protein [Fictibacillus sp. 18YEL24]
MDLEAYAKKIQKLLSKKEKQALKKIRKQYELIINEILLMLSELYMRLETEGTLSYSDVRRFNDIDRLQRRIRAQAVLLGDSNRRILNDLLEESYDLSYSFMSYGIEKEASVLLSDATPNIFGILQQNFDNPIYGLRLSAALERDRIFVVSDINAAIERGLIAGENYSGIAREIRGVFKSSYKRSVKIARTETHRVRERAMQDSSLNADKQGVKMVKIWRNMDDERVRKTKKANHVQMEKQTVPVDQPFVTIPDGLKGMCPGSMGAAHHDINCRCYASRRISHIESQVPKQVVKEVFEDWNRIKRAG